MPELSGMREIGLPSAVAKSTCLREGLFSFYMYCVLCINISYDRHINCSREAAFSAQSPFYGRIPVLCPVKLALIIILCLYIALPSPCCMRGSRILKRWGGGGVNFCNNVIEPKPG